MEATPYGLIKAFVPRVPLIGLTLARYTLGTSTTSPYWDLKTELLINVIRSFISKPVPEPLSKAQHISLKDAGVKGRLWVSRVSIPASKDPKTGQIVYDAIDALAPDGNAGAYLKPGMADCSAEWTGYRCDAAKNSPEPNIPESDKYAKMMEEVNSPITIMYIHGGAMYLMDPATHRLTTARLAKDTGGRVLSIRYRLAPQNPFPAALMDCLSSYLYLLYPPADALHTPVDAKNIVICGDSAGGNLSAALIALILTIRRIGTDQMITYGGKRVPLPLPAGIGLSSPWADTTHSFPSVVANKDFDYLPSPVIYPKGEPDFPKCAIWPTDPPRKAIYVVDSLRLHPLVNPVLFKDWSGAPPIYIAVGQELLTDEGKFLAQRIASDGVTVVYEEYQAMPHCFALVMTWIGESKKSFESWSNFIKDVVSGKKLATKASKTSAKTLKEEQLDISTLSAWTSEQVLQRMKDVVDHGAMLHKKGALAKL